MARSMQERVVDLNFRGLGLSLKKHQEVIAEYWERHLRYIWDV